MGTDFWEQVPDHDQDHDQEKDYCSDLMSSYLQKTYFKVNRAGAGLGLGLGVFSDAAVTPWTERFLIKVEAV